MLLPSNHLFYEKFNLLLLFFSDMKDQSVTIALSIIPFNHCFSRDTRTLFASFNRSVLPHGIFVVHHVQQAQKCQLCTMKTQKEIPGIHPTSYT